MLRRMWRKFRYRKPIIVISGLPRSGTSMMMKMLDAGGMPIAMDGVREADEDNPKGYYELERIKDLDKNKDKGWLAEMRGQAVKVISYLLKDLPQDNNYKIIFMERDIEEVVASQNKMMDRRNENNKTSDEKMLLNYKNHLLRVHIMLRHHPGFETLTVSYSDTLKDPMQQAVNINRFLGGSLNVRKMAEVVDPNLYRNRK